MSSGALAKRFREVTIDGRWIANTNFKDQITDLSWEQATHKVASLNSIAALCYHINYYIEGVAQVLKGGALEIKDKYSFDLPEINSQSEWEQLKDKFLSNAEKFCTLLENMNDEELQQAFVDEKYGSYQRNLDGMIEHCYYHMGQIVLIKKMILNKKAL